MEFVLLDFNYEPFAFFERWKFSFSQLVSGHVANLLSCNICCVFIIEEGHYVLIKKNTFGVVKIQVLLKRM